MTLDSRFAAILDGRAGEHEIRDFLIESIDLMTDPVALAAGARALRARMIPVTPPPGAIDVCGTGGDGAHTLNVSTAVAFVVAGCGAPVAKHGNRAMSSKSGAADVLEALGVRLTAHVPTLERCLDEAGIAFLFAQNHHPAMRHVAAARRDLGRRTIFNLLGPLANPAGVRRQLVGAFSADLLQPMTEALVALGAEHVMAIHGHGGLDELSCEGPSLIVEARGGRIETREILAGAYGLERADNAAIRGGTAEENAEHLSRLLNGDLAHSAYESFVALNAGAALVVAGLASGIAEGISRALASLRDGRARLALERLKALTAGAT
jgi:anthranilate phosphoribosyltransferase